MCRHLLLTPARVACFLLVGQALLANGTQAQAQGTPGYTYTSSPSGTPRLNSSVNGSEILIDARVALHGNSGNYSTIFNWSTKAEPKGEPEYEIKHQTKFLACPDFSKDSNWYSIKNQTWRQMAPPHTNVTLWVRHNTTRHTAAHSVVTPAKEPMSSVTNLFAEHDSYWMATLDPDCKKRNGDNMTVQFVVKVMNDELLELSPVINLTERVEGRGAVLSLLQQKLLPFTNYTLTATPANHVGAAASHSLTRTVTFCTAPGKPGPVRDLEVVAASPHRLKVAWRPPTDHPPKGTLRGFKVYWHRQNDTTPSSSKIIQNGSITALVIDGLEPVTAYTIKVRAMNEGTRGGGKANSVTGNTTEERDPASPGVRVADSGATTLHFSISPSGIDAIANFTVSLYEGNTNIRNITSNTTTTKFVDLTPSTRYLVRVKACTPGGRCSNSTEIETRTWPSEPRTLYHFAHTDTTATFILPTVESAPGWVWVLVLKVGSRTSDQGHPGTDEVKRRCVEMVRQEGRDTCSRGVCSSGEARSDGRLYIAEAIQVTGDENRLMVTLGDDSSRGDGPLESGTEYLVTVVAEVTAGGSTQYLAYEPLMVKTWPCPHYRDACEPKAFQEPRLLHPNDQVSMAVLGGMCGGAVLLTVLVVKCKNRRLVGN